MRILIVDDDHFQRALLEMVVKDRVRCCFGQDGAIAWKMMEEERFRMVITDWLMEGWTGSS